MVNPFGPVLEDIHDELWEHDYLVSEGEEDPFTYTDTEFRATMKIFMNAMLYKYWEKYQDKPQEVKNKDAEDIGVSISRLVKLYTGIDTFKLYDDIK